EQGEEGRGECQQQSNHGNDASKKSDLQCCTSEAIHGNRHHDSKEGEELTSPRHPVTMTSDPEEELVMSPPPQEEEGHKMAATEMVSTEPGCTDGEMGTEGEDKYGGGFTFNHEGSRASAQQWTQRGDHHTNRVDNNNSSSAGGASCSGNGPQSSIQRDGGREKDQRDGGREKDQRDGGREKDQRDGGREKDQRDGGREKDQSGRDPDLPEPAGGSPGSAKPTRKTRKPDREIYQPGGRRSTTSTQGKEVGRETKKPNTPGERGGVEEKGRDGRCEEKERRQGRRETGKAAAAVSDPVSENLTGKMEKLSVTVPAGREEEDERGGEEKGQGQERYSKSDIRRPRNRTYSTSSASSGTSLDGPGLGQGGGLGEDRARRDRLGRRERERGEGGGGQLQNRRRSTRDSSTDSLEESKELWSPERRKRGEESRGTGGRHRGGGGRGGLLRISHSDRQQDTGPRSRGRGILILPAHTNLSNLPAEAGPRLLFGGIRGGRDAALGRGGGRGGGTRRLWDPNNPDQKPALGLSQHASHQQQPMYLQTGVGYGALHFLDTDDEAAGSPPVRQGEHFHLQQQAAAMAQAFYKYQNSDNPYPYNANPNPNTRYPYPYHTMPAGPYQIPPSNDMYHPGQFYGGYRGQGYPDGPEAVAGGGSGAGVTPEEAGQHARGELGRLLRAADSQELQLTNLQLSADGLDRMAQLRADLLTLYERVILTDIEFSDSQNLDQALWKNVFYQVIERFRQLLKDPSGDSAPRITTMLLTLLDEVHTLNKQASISCYLKHV
ncbi:unnamed protein product, partial [Oncorhynchus mykiss]